MTTIAFYISGHGFGHASRAIEVINTLLARRSDWRVIVRTSAAKWLFDLTADHGVEHYPLETDTGIVQIDSLHLDEAATLARAREFMRTFEQRVADEAAFLTNERAALVVADLPALGIAAASRASLPAVALGNFTWDWIYAGYDGTADLAGVIAAAYSTADVALRLPMHGGFDSFRRVIDLPFVARRSRRDASDTRRALGLPEGERLVLVSFGGYGVAGLDMDSLASLDGYVVVVSGTGPMTAALTAVRRGAVLPLDESAMYAAGFRYEDLVRAVDVVVSKPGYGIISECIANDTALLYTSRGHFVEYDVLVAELPRFLRARFISNDDLLAGRWSEHLDALVAQPSPPETPRVDGADHAARHLLDMIESR